MGILGRMLAMLGSVQGAGCSACRAGWPIPHPPRPGKKGRAKKHDPVAAIRKTIGVPGAALVRKSRAPGILRGYSLQSSVIANKGGIHEPHHAHGLFSSALPQSLFP